MYIHTISSSDYCLESGRGVYPRLILQYWWSIAWEYVYIAESELHNIGVRMPPLASTRRSICQGGVPPALGEKGTGHSLK